MDTRKDILDGYTEYGLMKKYKDQAVVVQQLEGYIKTGDSGLITRDKNYRTLFEKELSPQTVNELTQGDVFKYVSGVLNDIGKRDFILGECKKVYVQSGKHMLAGALSSSLSGNFNLFSNPELMAGGVSPQDMYNFIIHVIGNHVTGLTDTFGMQAAEILAVQFNRELVEAQQDYYGEQSSSGSQRR